MSDMEKIGYQVKDSTEEVVYQMTQQQEEINKKILEKLIELQQRWR
jgi:hypothetical protein